MIANGSKGEMQGPHGPILLGLVANRFMEVKGKEHIELYKIRENSICDMFICGKCKGGLINRHNVLSPNISQVPLDLAVVNCPVRDCKPFSHKEATGRTWTDHWQPKH